MPGMEDVLVAVIVGPSDAPLSDPVVGEPVVDSEPVVEPEPAVIGPVVEPDRKVPPMPVAPAETRQRAWIVSGPCMAAGPFNEKADLGGDRMAGPLMEYKASLTEFKALGDAPDGSYEGYFSIIGNKDDGYPPDIIEPGAFAGTIQRRGRRVKVFYAHDWEKLIGPSPDILQEDSKGLYAKGRLTLDAFWGREVFVLMKDNALNEGSIGYSSLKATWAEEDDEIIRHLFEIELYEISPVPLGMNPLTQIQVVKSALLGRMGYKSAIPSHSPAKASDDTEWDASAVLKECEGEKQLRLVHAWVDSEGDPDAKSSYKLPHHLANGNVVLDGVQAAGNIVQGGRGGVKIPEADMAGVKRHLARHYGQFDKTPPWEKEEEALDVYLHELAWSIDSIKSGRVLSSASKEKVQTALSAMTAAKDALEQLIAASEPEPEPEAEPEKQIIVASPNPKVANAQVVLASRLRSAEQALFLATR